MAIQMLRFNSKYFSSFPAAVVASALLLVAGGCTRSNSRVAASKPGQHLDFNKDVQPILASNCFSCHGPDPEMRKAGLRLDLGQQSRGRSRQSHGRAVNRTGALDRLPGRCRLVHVGLPEASQSSAAYLIRHSLVHAAGIP